MLPSLGSTKYPTSDTEIHEFSDRPYFDAITQESEAQESMEENEDEHYTQSFEYISEEEAGEPWQEEEEYTGEEEQPEEDKEKKKKKQSQEEYDAERKVLLEKARAQIAEKQAKRQEQERGFKTPVDKSHDWKFYTENGYIATSGNRTTGPERRFGGTTTTSTSTRKEKESRSLRRQEKEKEDHTSRFSPETLRTQRTGKRWEN